jgi:hypothetical protein
LPRRSEENLENQVKMGVSIAYALYWVVGSHISSGRRKISERKRSWSVTHGPVQDVY